jgi:hypothetical protein
LLPGASSLATKGNRLCYHAATSLLPWQRWYEGRLTLLQRATDLATTGNQPCYHAWRRCYVAAGVAIKGALRCYHGAAEMPPVPTGVATKGALSCYHGVAALLQMLFSFCCKGRPPLLLRRGGVATHGKAALLQAAAIPEGCGGTARGSGVSASGDDHATSPATWRRPFRTTSAAGGGDA